MPQKQGQSSIFANGLGITAHIIMFDALNQTLQQLVCRVMPWLHLPFHYDLTWLDLEQPSRLSLNYSTYRIVNIIINVFYLIFLTYFILYPNFYVLCFNIYRILICDEYEGGAQPTVAPDYWDYQATDKYGGKLTTLLNFMYADAK